MNGSSVESAEEPNIELVLRGRRCVSVLLLLLKRPHRRSRPEGGRQRSKPGQKNIATGTNGKPGQKHVYKKIETVCLSLLTVSKGEKAQNRFQFSHQVNCISQEIKV